MENSLATGVGYWHKTCSSGTRKPSLCQNLCGPPPLGKAKTKGHREMLGQGLGHCPPPLRQTVMVQFQPQPCPRDMWICHFWDGRKGRAQRHGFCRATSSSPRGSQPAGQTWGDAGKLDIIYSDISKAYGKHFRIRLFRNRRHYKEIRNWLGDIKSRVGINI